MGRIADAIRKATRPATARVLNDLGSTVRFLRGTDVRQGDNTVRRSYGGLTGGAEWRVKLTVLTAEEAVKVWGTDDAVTVEGLMPVGPDVRPGDGVEVIDGFLVGQRFDVAQVIPSDLAQTVTLGLESREEAFPS